MVQNPEYFALQVPTLISCFAEAYLYLIVFMIRIIIENSSV